MKERWTEKETYHRCVGREYDMKGAGEARAIGEKKSLKRYFDPSNILRSPPGIKAIETINGFGRRVAPTYEQGCRYPHGRETNRPIASKSWKSQAPPAFLWFVIRTRRVLPPVWWRSAMATWIVGGFACARGGWWARERCTEAAIGREIIGDNGRADVALGESFRGENANMTG